MPELRSQYFKHDYDARSDERITKLRMKMKAAGYGIYWLVIEKLYQSNGRLDRDFVALSWSLHEDAKDIKAVVEDFDLFYDAKGKIACKRVDCELDYRADMAEKASRAGRKSARQRAFNDRSTTVQPEEKRREEERKEEDSKDGRATSLSVDKSLGKYPSALEAQINREAVLKSLKGLAFEKGLPPNIKGRNPR